MSGQCRSFLWINGILLIIIVQVKLGEGILWRQVYQPDSTVVFATGQFPVNTCGTGSKGVRFFMTGKDRQAT
jgi:hypothetical protein